MVDVVSATEIALRDIQRELADMRDDRLVMISILNRIDASVSSHTIEIRTLRSQFDRFRNETRESFAEIRESLTRIEEKS